MLGVVPHIDEMGIDDEDSVSLEEKQSAPQASEGKLRLAVIQTPKISNFTDFASLSAEPDVELYYVQEASGLGEPDLMLLPYQMESDHGEVAGFGLLPIITTFSKEKLLTQVKAACEGMSFAGSKSLQAENMPGYEIHMGQTDFMAETIHPFTIRQGKGEDVTEHDGAVSFDGMVLGTYIHGIFDHDGFRRQLLNALRQKKGWQALTEQRNQHKEKEAAYERLADVVEKSLDMGKLAAIMDEGEDH